jgi:hypothetical protein
VLINGLIINGLIILKAIYKEVMETWKVETALSSLALFLSLPPIHHKGNHTLPTMTFGLASEPKQWSQETMD